jgi:hypothetical protein
VKRIFVGRTVFAAMNGAVAQDQLPRIPREQVTEVQKQAVTVIIAGRALRWLLPLAPESVAECRIRRGW